MYKLNTAYLLDQHKKNAIIFQKAVDEIMSYRSVEGLLTDGLLKYVQHRHHMRGTLMQLLPQPPVKLVNKEGQLAKLPQFLPVWKTDTPVKKSRINGTGLSGSDISGANSRLNTFDLDISAIESDNN